MSRLTIDCAACGGPMPLGRRCPHCGARPRGGSLRTLVLRFALLGAASCGSLTAVPYGIAPTEPNGPTEPNESCQAQRVGDVCACSGSSGLCACTAAGTCEPYMFDAGSFDAGTDGG